MSQEPPKKVAVVSLGCPKNTVDSEVLLGRLRREGYISTPDPEDADVVVVNTCGFIEAAKRESVDAILQAVRLKESGRAKTLAVGGCLAQRYGEELRREIPEIDLLFGLNDVEALPEALRRGAREAPPGTRPPLLPASLEEAVYVYDASSPRLLTTPAHYAYVKISEGCDLPCSFCIIPKIRGRHRSRPLEDVEEECRALAERGVKEVCLVAQDSTWYGTDLYGKPRTAELLRRLARLEGLEWIRLHYLYPTRVTEELLDAMAEEPKVCAYFDMPMQHGSDAVLSRMRRLGRRADYLALLSRIRERAPEAAVRSTFIVGFPGETEGEFSELLDFLIEARLDFAGFFAYSREEHTPAGDLPGQVPAGVKRERLARAQVLQERLTAEFQERWVGRVLPVRVEGVREGEAFGRAAHQAPEVDGVVWLEGKAPPPGVLVSAEVTGVLGYDLSARLPPAG